MSPIFIFGDPPVGGVVDLFEKAAIGLGRAILKYSVFRFLLTRLRRESEGAVVLYYLKRGPDDADNHLLKMSERKARVIVLAHEDKYHAARAVGCLRHGAYDFRNVENFPRTAEGIHLLMLHPHLPYPRIDAPSLQMSATVFVVSAFDPTIQTRFKLACDLTLSGLKLRPDWGNSTRSTGLLLPDKLIKSIRASSLVIANFCEPYNLNVTAEAGIAQGASIPFLLAWRRTPAAIPTDFIGFDQLEYDEDVDFAVQLFQGLRPNVTWPLIP